MSSAPECLKASKGTVGALELKAYERPDSVVVLCFFMSQMSVNVRHKNDGKTKILCQVFRVRPSLRKLCENIKKQILDMAKRRQAKMLIFGVPGAACFLSRGGPGGFPGRLSPRGTHVAGGPGKPQDTD